jgi:hypothetical protein
VSDETDDLRRPLLLFMGVTAVHGQVVTIDDFNAMDPALPAE